MNEGRLVQVEDTASFEERALLFKALGHPARLAIVDALSDGELDVTSINGRVGSDLSTISRHLLQLKTAGVLASRRDGKQIFYRLRTPCVVTVLRCVSTIVGDGAAPITDGAVPAASPCGSLCREAADASASSPSAVGRRPAGTRSRRR